MANRTVRKRHQSEDDQGQDDGQGLAPLHELILSTVLTSPKVFADDTTLPVLDPGRGRTKTRRLWCYAVDNRPWQGLDDPAAA